MSSPNTNAAIAEAGRDATEIGWLVSWPELPYLPPITVGRPARRRWWARGRHRATRFSITAADLGARVRGNDR